MKITIVLVLLLASWELFLTAWISDDAGITFRTVLNFVHGFGPVYNIAERVQAYTHPLWFLILTLGQRVTGNIVLATFLLSWLFSIAALGLLMVGLSRTHRSGLLAVFILLCSRSWVDYSTSGLENPLSHLLIFLAVWLGDRAMERKSFRATLTFLLSCSCLVLNRHDLILIILPLAAWVLQQAHRSVLQTLGALLAGAIPVAAWSAFSLLYYGFIFPNTAYAKLNTGLLLTDRIIQGFAYLVISVSHDPLLLPALAGAVWLGFRVAGRDARLAGGILLYIGYLLIIGGDFMSGRFLSVPLAMAAALFAGARTSRGFTVLAWIMIAVGVFQFPRVIEINTPLPNLDIHHGVADERAHYYEPQGLLPLVGWPPVFSRLPDYETIWRTSDPAMRRTAVTGRIGIVVLGEGPHLHVIDQMALADPLLSRIKPLDGQRVGHWCRAVPDQYPESVETDGNLLQRDELRALYDQIRLITRGPLLSRERLRAVIRFLVRPQPLLVYTVEDAVGDEVIRKNVPPLSVMVDSLAVDVVEGGAWDAPGNLVFPADRPGIEIVFPRQRVHSLDCSLDHNDQYRLEYFDGQQFQPLLELGPADPDYPEGMIRYRRDLPADLPPMERIRVIPAAGDGSYSIGHFHVQ